MAAVLEVKNRILGTRQLKFALTSEDMGDRHAGVPILINRTPFLIARHEVDGYEGAHHTFGIVRLSIIPDDIGAGIALSLMQGDQFWLFPNDELAKHPDKIVEYLPYMKLNSNVILDILSK